LSAADGEEITKGGEMDVLIGLFCIGAVICVSIFLFNFVLTLIIMIISMVVAGITALGGWIVSLFTKNAKDSKDF